MALFKSRFFYDLLTSRWRVVDLLEQLAFFWGAARPCVRARWEKGGVQQEKWWKKWLIALEIIDYNRQEEDFVAKNMECHCWR